jgi:hypothetical protein
MTRGTWIYRNGRLVEKGGPDDVRPAVQRADLPCPMLISDTMEAAEHVDGRFYTSKSEFRKVTKANGLTEVGTEKLNRPQPKMSKAQRDQGINQAVEKAIARAL